MAENAATVDLKEFQLHEKDTGSADVQVALLTKRIAQLTEHLKTNAKDHSSRRGPFENGRAAPEPARLSQPLEKRALQKGDRQAESAEVTAVPRRSRRKQQLQGQADKAPWVLGFRAEGKQAACRRLGIDTYNQGDRPGFSHIQESKNATQGHGANRRQFYLY